MKIFKFNTYGFELLLFCNFDPTKSSHLGSYYETAHSNFFLTFALVFSWYYFAMADINTHMNRTFKIFWFWLDEIR